MSEKTEDIEAQQAIEVIARHIIAGAAVEMAESGWDALPDIGEYDYERVIEAVKRLVPDVGTAEFARAYALLEKRAGEES